MQHNLQFTVDSALLEELGMKLVETVHVALSELVKNSYDADATEVKIIFGKNEEGKDRIQIIDNGTGMSFNAVQDYWMRIATTNKEKRNVSPVFGRPLTGAKGIGRFSCRRLGSKLTLITKGTENNNIQGEHSLIQMTKVEFPWNDFKAGLDVTKITCKGEQTEFKNNKTGTILIIDDISNEWNIRGVNWLKRQLGVLAANRGAKRDGYRIDPGFNIFLEAPDFEGGIHNIREDLINAGWGTLKAHINSKQQAVCELTALGIGRKTIISNRTFKKLTDVKLEVGILVEDRRQMRDLSVISKTSINEILPEWGGVQVTFRGFRVFPYGDDDWLDINFDRGLRRGTPKNELMVFAESLRGIDASRSLLNLLSMRNHVGTVEIGDRATGFEMKLSREGFIESETTKELKEFVRYAIDWSTILRDYYLRQEDQRLAKIAKEEFENLINARIESNRTVESAINYIENEVKTVARYLEPEERRKVEQTFSKATEVIKKQNESNKAELTHLRLIASTSTLLLIFSHEVKSLLGLLETSKNSLYRIAKTLPNTEKNEIISIGESFNELKDRLNELLQLTTLISTNKGLAKPGQVALRSKIERVEKVFQLILNKYEIKVDYSQIRNNIAIKKILEAELYSILLNVMSNSIKAVIANGQDKRIEFDSYIENEETIIVVRDTGIGLSEEQFEEVFTPFVSDPEGKLYLSLENRINPEDSTIVGMGSGLGLGIVKEIVLAHEGQIKFVKPEKPWSTKLEIRLK
jgi:signal transduction histidine kinase